MGLTRMAANQTNEQDDPFDLNRFVRAQEESYARALAEISSGQKRSHWMWYIFPQIDGLGSSPTTKFYAIKSLQEAQQYLIHPVLGKRLQECVERLLGLEGRTVSEIFGYPDDLKLRSCLTLFANVAGQSSPFERVLTKYFHGERDARTLDILAKLKSP